MKFKGYEDDSIWLKSFKGRVQPKQEWSEKDEHCIELLLPIIDSSSLIPKNRKKCKEFLKSLKDRVQSQPKQEWSEEDSERLDRIRKFIWANRKGDTDEIYQLEQDADWLMTLKHQPKLEWNKEDEFMLTRCIGILGKCYIGELPTKVEEELVWLISVKELIRN